MVNKKTALIVVVAVLAAAIGSVIPVVAAMKSSNVGVTVDEYLGRALGKVVSKTKEFNISWPFALPLKRWKCGFAPHSAFVELSEEFKQKVVEILKSDTDTSALLSSGYNITCIEPILRLVVQGDGSVTMKVTKVIVLMVKPGEGKALAYVDLETGTVEKLVKCEVKVKSSETSMDTPGSARALPESIRI